MEQTENKKKKFDLKSFLKNFEWKEFFKEHSYEITAALGLVVCLILFSFLPQVLNGPKASLWRPAVFSAFIEQVTVYLILAMGASFVYMMGCMDISVGYQVGVFGTIFILIANATGSIFLGLITIIMLGFLCAVFNSFVGAYVKLPQVMSSVILMQLFSGLMTRMYSDSGIASNSLSISIKDALNPTWVRVISLIVLALIASFLISYSKVGKRAKAIGANKIAAQQAGADLLKTRIICYGIFSIFLCLAAIFLIARKDGIGEADSSSYQMDIMIMLLMGGMPLSGGMKCKLSNAIIGTITYVLISLGLGLCRVSAEYIFLVKSVIFVVIVFLTCRTNGKLLPR